MTDKRQPVDGMSDSPSPESLRDSTEIRVPCDALAPIREDVESEFAVSVFDDDGPESDCRCRIVGSPVAIRAVGTYLARHGVVHP
jgi:hypothetical protein